MKLTVTRSHTPKALVYVKVLSKQPHLSPKRPVAFVLPGGPGADHSFYQPYQCLHPVTDLVFHDPRGCGESTSPLPACTMDNYIDDIEAIRQSLDIQKIILIGKSYGSMCALGYALRYPKQVKKLILVAGAPSYRFIERAKQTIQRIGTPEQIKWCEKLWQGNFQNPQEMLRYFEVTQSLYAVTTPNKPIDLTKKSHQFNYEVLNLGFSQSFWFFDYENQLSAIEVPTLVLAGEEDWINDVYFARFMAEHIPYSFLKTFSPAGHAMEQDVGITFYQTIADFIENL